MKNKASKKEKTAIDEDFETNFFNIDYKKEKPKITDQAPCPICGGCVWYIGDKYKCGWCGYDGNDTNQSRALKG